MNKAIVLTAFSRFAYLDDVFDSWSKVRGLDTWDFYVSIDYSPVQQQVEEYIETLADEHNMKIHSILQKKNLGVLKHPVVIMDRLFRDYDFVLRTEDDLVVSDGILEYYDHLSEEFAFDERVQTIHGFSVDDRTDNQNTVSLLYQFNPWVWGTWKHKWINLSSNWDYDYSTYEDRPGNKSGFDWNFNLRVYPKNNWFGVFPDVSRVKNIGAWGVHGTPENLPISKSFIPNNRPFREDE